MANYAVIENNKVINVIVADTKEIAEELTGLTCVESTSENPAYIRLGFDGTEFEKPTVTE
jgi:hypothetical protein